jgi:RNA polymerase sigma-70 factor (ECF subfamily)
MTPTLAPLGEALPRPATFATTHWSVVLEAGHGDSDRATQALETLCRIYWYPTYTFVRRQGHTPEEAQDLTQGFFARLLQRGDFAAICREKGRFRSYLLVALKHFLANEKHHARAQKRGGGQTPVPLDGLVAEERYRLEPVDALSADKIFERRWALTVLGRVLERIGSEYAAAGNGALLEGLKDLLSDDPGRPSQAELARALGMTENAVKQAFHRFRVRYRELLREEIAHTLATPGEIEDELRYLVAVLRG